MSMSPEVGPPKLEVPQMPLAEPEEVSSLSGRDWVAIWFAIGILVFMAVVYCVLLKEWYTPPAPSLTAIPLASQKEAIEQYKDLASVMGERLDKGVDLLITKGLLPIFATLLGFILGKRSD